MAEYTGVPNERTPWRSLGQVVVVALVIALVGVLAGYLFGRADPQRAARLLTRDLVLTEPEGEATGLPAPTTGEFVGPPTCGFVAEPLDRQQQLDAVAAGVVVVQFREPDDTDALAAFAADQGRSTLVAPNPDLPARVVATAWGRRMRLEQHDAQLLDAFVRAHAGFGPAVTACP